MLGFYLSMLDTDEERNLLTDIYEEHQYWCLQAAMKITKNREDAEDAVHEAFICLINNRDILKLPREKIKHLLITIAKRRAIDIVRKREHSATEAWDDMEDFPSMDESIDLQIEKAEDFERLHTYLQMLNERYSTVLEMKYYSELSNEKIGQILGKTTRQVEQMLYRAKLKLREVIDDGGDENDR